MLIAEGEYIHVLTNSHQHSLTATAKEATADPLHTGSFLIPTI